jgi:hypothetical protein
MTEDQAARVLPTCPPTYLQRRGTLVCTTCGALIGATEADLEHPYGSISFPQHGCGYPPA